MQLIAKVLSEVLAYLCMFGHVPQCRSNLIICKLVTSKSSHAGFNASSSQGNEHQSHHRQSSEGMTYSQHKSV